MSGWRTGFIRRPPICPTMSARSRIWPAVHRELRRLGVTLMLLWEEYCDTTSDGFSYSWFCERYKEWACRLKLSMRQVHNAGDKLFVDYSGHTMEVIDAATGEVLAVQIFVAVLGASNYT